MNCLRNSLSPLRPLISGSFIWLMSGEAGTRTRPPRLYSAYTPIMQSLKLHTSFPRQRPQSLRLCTQPCRSRQGQWRNMAGLYPIHQIRRGTRSFHLPTLPTLPTVPSKSRLTMSRPSGKKNSKHSKTTSTGSPLKSSSPTFLPHTCRLAPPSASLSPTQPHSTRPFRLHSSLAVRNSSFRRYRRSMPANVASWVNGRCTSSGREGTCLRLRKGRDRSSLRGSRGCIERLLFVCDITQRSGKFFVSLPFSI